MTEKSTVAAENGDDLVWAERSEFWQNYRPVIRGRHKKFHYREPVILCGHGVRVRVDRSTLLIQDGFTHYPQKTETRRFFPGDPELPDRIIILDGSGGISFDALNWMADQQIAFVQLNWRGDVTFVAGNSGYSANRKLVERQIAIRGTAKAAEIARWLVLEKIIASIETILTVFPEGENREIALAQLKKWRDKIEQCGKGSTIPKIMGIEGAAAAAYFQCWQGLPLNWSKSQKRPIPDSWRKVGSRTMGWRKTGQNARHPFNAMLNYGYGILVSQLRAEAIAAGIDLELGIMHGTKQNRIPLVYDLMEPLRPVVDKAILNFALSQTFSAGDIAINKWGGCRLNPQMARAVAKRVSTIEASDVPKVALKMLT